MSALRHRFLNTVSLLWYSSVVVLLGIGWLLRDYKYLIPESGIGYWLGIIGGSLMLLLLYYPVRKRSSRLGMSGSIKFWFRLHMILGVVGPVLIMFHSNFSLGSMNSFVALFCMITVALSGLVGRYLYQKIHHGLYGKKVTVEEFNIDSGKLQELGSQLKQRAPDIFEDLKDIELELSHRHTGINRSMGFYRKQKSQVKRLTRKVKSSLAKSPGKKQLIHRLSELRSICDLGLNEIWFSYWHILHLPLFFMLILTGIIHVVVVHFY